MLDDEEKSAKRRSLREKSNLKRFVTGVDEIVTIGSLLRRRGWRR